MPGPDWHLSLWQLGSHETWTAQCRSDAREQERCIQLESWKEAWKQQPEVIVGGSQVEQGGTGSGATGIRSTDMATPSSCP